MGNFKVDDVVVCIDNSRYGNQIKVGVPKLVDSVSSCGQYLRVLRDDNGQLGGYSKEDFIIADTMLDDPLPPVPESVRYYNSYIFGHNDQHLVLDGHNASHPGMNLMYLGIVPRTGSTRADKEIGINMDADTALQLAHDLRRMAMEIKRKEKNND